jgi:N-hydroxyarylamine O-acetyltransferase
VLDVPGYLRRLRLDHPGSPSVAGLTALQRAHVAHVPYSTVDIQLGRPGTLDPVESVARIVSTGRAGYCYQLNGAFSLLLSQLGYDVRHHRGVVSSGEPISLRPFPNHLALTVHGLSTSDNPDGRWLVDTGLGDAMYEPLALRSAAVRQGDFEYELRASTALPDGWHFQHDPRGSFHRMDFESSTARMADFARGHRNLSTAATSPFVQHLTVQRRDATGFDKLISRSLIRVDARGRVLREIGSAAQLFDAVADIFGLSLDDLTGGDRDELWRRACAGHLAWLKERDADG